MRSALSAGTGSRLKLGLAVLACRQSGSVGACVGIALHYKAGVHSQGMGDREANLFCIAGRVVSLASMPPCISKIA